MSDELSRSAVNTIYTLSTAWENEDIPPAFEARVTEEGQIKAEGLSPLSPDALNQMANKGLIRVTEVKEGQYAIKLLPALHRAAQDERAADKQRERDYRIRARNLITGGL